MGASKLTPAQQTTLTSLKANPNQQITGTKPTVGDYGYSKTASGTVTPTVISSSTINKNTIPDLNNKAAQLSIPGAAQVNGQDPKTDPNAMPSYMDEYNKAFKANSGGTDTLSPDQQAQMDLIDHIMQTSDNYTKNLIGSIHQTASTNVQALQRQQQYAQAQNETALSLGGSARYAPISSQGIISAQDQGNLIAISQLQNKENSLVLDAQKAQQDGDYKALEQKLALIGDARKEKIALAQKTADSVVQQANADRTYKMQAEQQRLAKENDMVKGLGYGLVSSLTGDPTVDQANIAKVAEHYGIDAGKLLSEVQQQKVAQHTTELDNKIKQSNMDLAQQKFAEDKRQFGLTYAQNQAKINSSGSGGGGTGGSGTGGASSDTETIAQAIMNGNQPPVLTGLYSKSAGVKAALERKGYNLTKATQDWTATQKLLATLNGAQQTKLRESVNQVDESLGLTQKLADEWNGSNFPALNKATLLAAKQGALGQDAQSLATRLDAQISDITSELATVYKGGNSSTDESLKLAASQLSSSWSKKTFDDAIGLAKQNIQYRKNSMNVPTAGISDSKYNSYTPPVTASAPVTAPDGNTYVFTD